MGLKIESIYRRLKVLLAYHDKLRDENKDKKALDKTAHKIHRLVYLLEHPKHQGKQSAGLDE